MMLTSRSAAALLACALFAPSVAAAHPAPADPPDFGTTDCVARVDKSAQSKLAIPYRVQQDVTVLSQGDLPLPDANTYQFFAFDGLVVPYASGWQLYPFQPKEADPVELPIWITTDDVKRAANASHTVEGVLLSQSSIPPDRVLTENAGMHGHFLRVTSDDARIPITIAAAMQGASWDLSTVPPGGYTLVAYIFSPPNNGWAIRPGVVKVVDAASDPPAGSIASIQEHVFSYQARRVHACLDVPPGTRLDAYFSIDERPDLGWTSWLADREVSSGALDLCFHMPVDGISGSVHLRMDLVTKDGSATTLHSPDTLTALVGSGACSETDTLCCDFPGSLRAEAHYADAALPDAGSTRAPDAGPASSSVLAAKSKARTAGPSKRPSSGCAVAARRGTAAWIACVTVLLALRARRRRHSHIATAADRVVRSPA
jgi:hypothetical protein